MKTPERIFDERNWFATEEEMSIVEEMMIEYAEQFKDSKNGYCQGSTDAHKLLLKTLYNEIEANCEEHIRSGGLRFYGVSFAEIKSIFEVLGYIQEPKF